MMDEGRLSAKDLMAEGTKTSGVLVKRLSIVRRIEGVVVC